MVNTVDADAVDPGDVAIDSVVFKGCGVVEEHSSSTRFKLDVVAAGLLIIEKAVDSLLVDSRLRRGVDPNRRVVGFTLVDVVDALISVDANSVVVVDPRCVVVVFKRCGVLDEYSSSTRCGVVPWLFMFVLDVEVVDSILVIRNWVGVDANDVDPWSVIVDSTVVERCGVVEEYSSST